MTLDKLINLEASVLVSSTAECHFCLRDISRMMCKSMLSTNAEIAPMHCCLGEPDCFARIMLLFQTDLGRQHACTAVVSVSVLALLHACIKVSCMFLSSTSSHYESLAIMIV